MQTLQGKISMYDYYSALEKLTDNTGLQRCKASLLCIVPAKLLTPIKIQDRYNSFMRVMCEWQFLKMLKRGGRGHDATGVTGTRAGELAVLCPACPHLDINLPDNWELCSDDMK
jgi:hypothetical protein